MSRSNHKKIIRKIITLEQAQTILKSYHSLILSCVLDGFKDYLKISQARIELATYTEHTARTKANFLHDSVAANIKKHFGSLSNIKAEDFKGIFALQIEDVFIRFKKISPTRFTGSNVNTQQTKDYYKQLIIKGFPEEPTLLFLGYEPDKLFSSIENVYLVCRKDNNILWVIDLKSQVAMEQSSMNFDTVEVGSLGEAKVKIKEGLLDNEKTGTDDKFDNDIKN